MATEFDRWLFNEVFSAKRAEEALAIQQAEAEDPS